MCGLRANLIFRFFLFCITFIPRFLNYPTNRRRRPHCSLIENECQARRMTTKNKWRYRPSPAGNQNKLLLLWHMKHSFNVSKIFRFRIYQFGSINKAPDSKFPICGPINGVLQSLTYVDPCMRFGVLASNVLMGFLEGCK